MDTREVKSKLRSAFIALVLASQLLLPLRYYVGDDLFDERFAWRMFSPIRVTACRVEWFEVRDGARLPLQPSEDIPVPWVSLMTRARRSVISTYARRRCEQMSGSLDEPDLRAAVTCAHPDGEPRQVVTPAVNLCGAGR